MDFFLFCFHGIMSLPFHNIRKFYMTTHQEWQNDHKQNKEFFQMKLEMEICLSNWNHNSTGVISFAWRHSTKHKCICTQTWIRRYGLCMNGRKKKKKAYNLNARMEQYQVQSVFFFFFFNIYNFHCQGTIDYL